MFRISGDQIVGGTIGVEQVVRLHCLRCAQRSVIVNFLFQLSLRQCDECPSCGAKYLLKLLPRRGGFAALYHLWTRRYPPEMYDDDDAPIILLKARRRAASPSARETFSGPIVVYPRRRFTPSEVRAIWNASRRRCHICKRVWRLRDRSRAGWHIDHLIPHIGGGADVEELANMRVACARCNLGKGRGYTDKQVESALNELVEHLAAWPSILPKARVRDGSTNERS